MCHSFKASPFCFRQLSDADSLFCCHRCRCGNTVNAWASLAMLRTTCVSGVTLDLSAGSVFVMFYFLLQIAYPVHDVVAQFVLQN